MLKSAENICANFGPPLCPPLLPCLIYYIISWNEFPVGLQNSGHSVLSIARHDALLMKVAVRRKQISPHWKIASTAFIIKYVGSKYRTRAQSVLEKWPIDATAMLTCRISSCVCITVSVMQIKSTL